MHTNDSLEQFDTYGLFHLYTGDGKGKTTAAVGLAVRAAGCGANVIFAQFMKGGETGEIGSLNQLKNIRILRSEREFPFYQKMTDAQKEEITQIHDALLDRVRDAIADGSVDLIVFDEITYPYNWNLLSKERFREIVESAKGKVELICTGRDADHYLKENADYITEMCARKHPFELGISARKGIEY